MQGIKHRNGKLYYQINLERFVGKGHLLWRLERVISLNWVREKTKGYYSHTGRPSVDPIVLVKLLLIGYLYDIRSERRLVEEISLNLAYRWYTGYDLDEEVPNHSIFSKARKRFGKRLFVMVFEEILKECMKAGLVKGEEIFIDSTLMKANASMDSVVEVNLSPEKYWRQLEDEEKPKSPRGRKPIADQAMQLGSHFKGEVEEEKMGKRRRRRRVSYLWKRSKTDPDATVHFRPGLGSLLSYKTHMAATATGIVTAVCVSPSADHDTVKVPELIERHKKVLGLPGSVTADKSYGTEEALGYLQRQGIKTFISPMGTKNRPEQIKKELFKYHKRKDCYICPEGKVLKRRAKNRKTNQIEYRSKKEDCDRCCLRSQCIQGKAGSRLVTRYDSDYGDKARRWYDSQEGKLLSRLKRIIIEGLFGQAKAFHGLSKAKLRGIAKVEIQILMTAAILNLKKLAKETNNFILNFFELLFLKYKFVSLQEKEKS